MNLYPVIATLVDFLPMSQFDWLSLQILLAKLFIVG